MRKQLITSLLMAAFVMPTMIGCNRTVSEEKTVKTNPDTGRQSVDQKTVEKTPEGGTKTTTEHKSNTP